MPLIKHGTGDVVGTDDQGQQKKVASQTWSDADQSALDAENTDADKEH